MSTLHSPRIEVILPIYNEVANILPLMEQLDAVKARMKPKAEISFLFVNDGSRDGSRELLHRLYRSRKDVRVVDLVHNFGHGPAITCGLEHFSGDIAVLMDADMQDDPRAIEPMFEQWRAGHKTVVAARGQRKERLRFFFNAFYRIYHRIAPQMPSIKFGTFCLLDRSVVKRLRQLRERNRYFPGLVAFASTEIMPVPVDRMARAAGSSRVGMLGLFHLAITAMVSFSNAPVRSVSIFGLICAAGAILFGLGIIAVKLFTELAIPGWASIMTTSAFWSGIQLFCLGIIGEYIARMYDEVKRRPLYLVDRILEHKPRERTQEVA